MGIFQTCVTAGFGHERFEIGVCSAWCSRLSDAEISSSAIDLHSLYHVSKKKTVLRCEMTNRRTWHKS